MLKKVFLFVRYLMFDPAVKLISCEIDLSLEIHATFAAWPCFLILALFCLVSLLSSCFLFSFSPLYFFLHAPPVTWFSLSISINSLANPFSNILRASIFD